ncbi:MAG: hypothetical protein LBK75_00405 [Oscillospiraceae bacterium]|jgi:hypothetical protein|nr:hypothetical protein [Oscillospiraceae bacterium]
MDTSFPLAPDAPEALLHTAHTSPPGPEPSEPADTVDDAHTPAAVFLALLEACRSEADDTTRGETLLLALRPYLRPERRAQVERIAELVRLARAVYTGYQTTSGGEKHA